MVRSRALRGVSNHKASGEATMIRVNRKALPALRDGVGCANGSGVSGWLTSSKPTIEMAERHP
jgi:hypothetical protein